MLDELIFGFIAVLSLVTLFMTRRYMARLEEVAESTDKLLKSNKKTRKLLRQYMGIKDKHDEQD